MASKASGEQRTRGGSVPVAAFAAIVIVAFVIVAAATSEWIILASLGALALVAGGGLALAALLARNATAHDPALESVDDGAGGMTVAQAATAGAFFAGEDDPRTPLGDTTEAHDELSSHDLPLGHPSRRPAEELERRGERVSGSGPQRVPDSLRTERQRG